MEAMFRCSVQQKVTSGSRKPCKLKYSYPLIQESFFFSFQVFVQLLQFRYQSGVLYRLRALGISTKMDITLGKFMCLVQSLLNDQEPTFDI